MGKGLPRSLDGAILKPLAVEETNGELMAWKGYWQAIRYEKNDTVLDGTWLMVANKSTLDRAAPQIAGPPIDGIIGAPSWSTPTSTGVVYSGQSYTFTEPGRLVSVKAWVPSIGAGITHKVFLRDVTAGVETAITTEIASFIPTAGGWFEINLGGGLVNINTILQVFISSENKIGEVVTNANWFTTNNLGPLDGEWRRSNSTYNKFYISLIDNDAIDRTALLTSLTLGDTVEFTDTTDADKHILFDLLGPGFDEFFDGYLSFFGTPTAIGMNGSPERGFLANGVITEDTTSTVGYVEAVDYWLSNTIPFATAEGLLEVDGVAVAAMSNNAYGIDLIFRGGNLSPDWDLGSNIETVS